MSGKEITIKGWLARDEAGGICLFSLLPPLKLAYYWISDGPCIEIPSDAFQSVQWEDDEPTEVEVTIKIKKKCG